MLMETPTQESSKSYLTGEEIEVNEDYGGLGSHFLKTLFNNLNKIHQIDTVTGVTETNGSVRTRAIQIAQELRHHGIVENDIILICSRCHADQTVAILGSLLVGSIVAPIDAELHHKECVELVTQLKPKMCFCDLRTLKQIERVVVEIGLNVIMVHFGDQQQHALAFRKMLINRQQQMEQFKPVHIEQPRKRVAFILATQGVGGPPKLVCVSHHFIYSQILIFIEAMDSPEKVISYYSLSWVKQVILVCLCFMFPVVRILTGPFAERAACKLIQDLKIDHAFLNTDLAIQLIEHVAIKDFNLSCLRTVFIGSLLTTQHDIKRLTTRLPKVRFTQMYCTTEVGVVIASTPQDYPESLERIGTAGKVVHNCKLRVVNIETREDVGPECSGELLVAGDCMMLGYFKNLNATRTSFQNSYFKTGDIARYDVSGWLYIEGRIADLISIEGTNISPRELEDVIMMHPYVKDTAVISNNKEIVACVITKTDTKLDDNKLLAFISTRLPLHKWPGRIVFMDDFPTTPIGKIRRDLLKEEVLTVKIERSESNRHYKLNCPDTT